MTLRALIVDDELYSREEMAAMLQETGEFVVAGKCADALEAIRALRREKPDVLFLDVQMPVINGFELLGMIDEELIPSVVFVTAHDQYALKAFEENALDYLLKPVEKERLLKTVEKLKKRAGGAGKPVLIPLEIRKIPCVQSSRIKLIDTADVEVIRSDEAGVHVAYTGGELYTDLTLQILEMKTGLVRCHKQFLINMDRVDEILLRENMVAEIRTKSGRLVPVSRRYLRVLRERLHF
jgi:two-component system, LytTR family, response regulator